MTLEEQITAAWESLLTGSVTVGSYTFPAYRTNVPISQTRHYILIRKEGGVPNWNKAAFFRTFVLIVEIVTIFPVIINDKLVDDADDIIRGLVFNNPGSNNLNVSGLIKVDAGSPTYLDEDNGSQKIYRKITRFVHQVASNTA